MASLMLSFTLLMKLKATAAFAQRYPDVSEVYAKQEAG